MMYKIILLFIGCSTILTEAKVYDDCGSEIGNIESISISHCDVDGVDRCIFQRDNAYTLDVQFTVKGPVESMYMTVDVNNMVRHVKYPVSIPQLCNDRSSGITCSLSADGTVYHCRKTHYLPRNAARMTAAVKTEVKDDNNDKVFCIVAYEAIK